MKCLWCDTDCELINEDKKFNTHSEEPFTVTYYYFCPACEESLVDYDQMADVLRDLREKKISE